MRKIFEVLRLKFELGLAERAIATSCGIARSTVQDTLKRFGAAKLTWPLPVEVDEAVLHEQLYPPRQAAVEVPLPDFAAVQAELAKKGVTRLLLWQEYKGAHPHGLQYSAFCERLAAYAKSRDVVLRQSYRPGEKLFIDFAGPTVAVTDRASGEIKSASIFVAVLGYSNYTYACATPGQTTADWLGAQRATLEFLGGVPQIIVPDNPKAIISRACRYEPDLNPAYQDFARHYEVAVIPARVRAPRDKAKVEAGVLIVERWILARLRHQSFFSLAELNRAISELTAELNARAFKKLPGNRHVRFVNEEKHHLKPLPARPYEFAIWKPVRVHLDYHVELDKRYYSAPYTLIGKKLQARLTTRMVELFYRGKLVASHVRCPQPGRFTTAAEHRPPKHRAAIELNHERLRERAQAMGPATAAIIERQWLAKQHPEQTLRRSLGILRLARDFTPTRLEAACARALELNVLSYRAIRALLDAQGSAPVPAPAPQSELFTHENVRGPTYFNQESPCSPNL